MMAFNVLFNVNRSKSEINIIGYHTQFGDQILRYFRYNEVKVRNTSQSGPFVVTISDTIYPSNRKKYLVLPTIENKLYTSMVT